MSFSKDAREFGEDLLRLYLGKYAPQFKRFGDGGEILLLTDPYPVLVAHLVELPNGIEITLYEYIPIEEDDPYHATDKEEENTFDWYCSEIITIPVADPYGTTKMEKAVANSFLAGKKS